MGSPVCVAEKVWKGGLILRWYPSTHHYSRSWCLASARRGGVKHHAYQHEIPLHVQVAAEDAHDLMVRGDWTAVAAFATYRPVRRLFLRHLEPITVDVRCDGMPGRDPDQPHAVCGRLDRHGEHPLGGDRG